MKTLNLSQAKRKLSRLIDQATKGEPVIIARAGKQLVKVVPVDGADYTDDLDRMKKQERIKSFRGRLKWGGDF